MKILAKTLLLLLPFLLQPGMAAESTVVWTGGITFDEREAAPTGGTRLEFVVTSGNYLPAIRVSITDSNDREIVNTTTEGPWLILNLAPGTYHVQATRRNGDVQGGMISVDGDSGNFTYMFPDD